MNAQESITRAISKLAEAASGVCLHSDKLDTTTLGNNYKSFHCLECDGDFILLEENNG
jgi:hypothetical protein